MHLFYTRTRRYILQTLHFGRICNESANIVLGMRINKTCNYRVPRAFPVELKKCATLVGKRKEIVVFLEFMILLCSTRTFKISIFCYWGTRIGFSGWIQVHLSSSTRRVERRESCFSQVNYHILYVKFEF